LLAVLLAIREDGLAQYGRPENLTHTSEGLWATSQAEAGNASLLGFLAVRFS
jgi:hypothetical protein